MNARPGVNYLGVIHRVLSATTIEEAIEAVTNAPRAGAHYFYVADGKGHAVALETSPENVDRLDVNSGAHVHCNHCQIGVHREIEADTPAASSHARQNRLEGLIAGSAGQATWEDLRSYLSDRENGENAICRDDFNGISSNGAVIMEPEKRRVMACHGLPDRSDWVDLVSLSEGQGA